MNVFISLVILAGLLLVAGWLYSANAEKIKFFTTGLDSNFKIREISVLWKLAKECHLDNPIALYVSVPALNDCISKIVMKARADNTEKSYKVQQFLTRLYKYRTRIALDKADGKGLSDTHYLAEGQRLRIILPGKGVFASSLVCNSHELIIPLPYQKNKNNNGTTVLEGEEWEGKAISVYLWRAGDACYAFDTSVFTSGTFRGRNCLCIQHSDRLDRAQKRQSVRCKCEIYAQMYMIKSEVVDYNIVDQDPGYRCLLEDISEDGALIRIGGKGKVNVQIKLQFTINESFVMMYGIVRAVEYNKALDQSRLHFECIHIDPPMKNAILSYVYNVIPQDQKDINEAIMQTESDSLADAVEGEAEPETDESVSTGMDNPAESKQDGEKSVPADNTNLPLEAQKEAEKTTDSATENPQNKEAGDDEKKQS